ncbi:LacI family DNA-binding transcriptional regulator [Rhodococcus sp. 14-2470-1a]|uniref:LacI family DNA-binding transcriptional regulator n=1 Tax=Rhodococcus sp. 14-2470-1a TaxID=2023150 RepID=UPI000B9AF19A|nr:LacI family DNA-binding transcriptional regulator [Rhodococcus sp. 14-2470-1a]OZF58374.1 LacI family transcriptional regulator [Rhodococcus sp. 14-2470-1a]
MSRPTIRTVAAHAGVSKSLVSLVLRGSSSVSDEKRAAVEHAITELGYRPNLSARSLTQRRTDIVGVLLNDLRNPWFVDCLEGMNSVLQEQDLKMFLADGRLDRSSDSSFVRSFMDLRLDGLALVGTRTPTPTILEAARTIPTVVVASRDLDLPGVDVVANDDAMGTALAIDHLVALGHTRIAHLAGTGAVANIRAASYRAAMAEHGLDRFASVVPSGMTEDDGYAAASAILDGTDAPSAIFAVNDIVAIGAMTACKERQISVPEDISIVGYDNTSLAGLRHVWLTSVDNATYELGRLAATALVGRISDAAAPGTLTLIPPSLQVRGSTAAPH